MCRCASCRSAATSSRWPAGWKSRVAVRVCRARSSPHPDSRTKIDEAMAMADGARRVAAGMQRPAESPRGADLVEHRLLRLGPAAADDVGVVCASCGTEPREGARFCDRAVSAIAPSPQARGIQAGHCSVRRVVRSMDIASALGTERLREVMSELLSRSRAVVKRYGGTVGFHRRRNHGDIRRSDRPGRPRFSRLPGGA